MSDPTSRRGFLARLAGLSAAPFLLLTSLNDFFSDKPETASGPLTKAIPDPALAPSRALGSCLSLGHTSTNLVEFNFKTPSWRLL
jgi:hypothetical protein